MKWTPEKDWAGQQAYLIGGGSSLRKFHWKQLTGLNVIGCNDAYKLGPEIVKICLFGDTTWFERNKWDLDKWPGKIVSVAPEEHHLMLPWLHSMKRERDGLHDGPALGWNFSTGAAAINLAVTLGANRIFLLGYDLAADVAGKTHWHEHRGRPTVDASFRRFGKGFEKIAAALKRYPDVKVYNVTDGSSRLSCFQKITFAEMAKMRIQQKRDNLGNCPECVKRAEAAAELAAVA